MEVTVRMHQILKVLLHGQIFLQIRLKLYPCTSECDIFKHDVYHVQWVHQILERSQIGIQTVQYVFETGHDHVQCILRETIYFTLFPIVKLEGTMRRTLQLSKYTTECQIYYLMRILDMYLMFYRSAECSDRTL